MNGDENEHKKPPLLSKLAYTIPEVVKLTGIGRTSLYEDIRAGILKARKRGTKTIVLVENLIAYLQALPILEETSPPKPRKR